MSINVIKNIKSSAEEKVFIIKNSEIDESSSHDKNKVPVSEEFSKKYLSDLESLKKKTIQEAKEQGFYEGLEAGKKEAFDRLASEFEMIKNFIAELNNYKKSILEGLEDEILEVSIAVAEKIVREKVDKNEDYILKSLHFILMTIPQIRKLIIYLNPEDYQAINIKKGQLDDIFNRYEEVKIVDDKRVERGGVVVETENGNIDAQISSQIDKLSKELFTHEK
jgi:flagellar assembly protein FliH